MPFIHNELAKIKMKKGEMGTPYTLLVELYISITVLEANLAKSNKDENAQTLPTQKFHFLVYTLQKPLYLCNKETKQCP